MHRPAVAGCGAETPTPDRFHRALVQSEAQTLLDANILRNASRVDLDDQRDGTLHPGFAGLLAVVGLLLEQQDGVGRETLRPTRAARPRAAGSGIRTTAVADAAAIAAAVAAARTRPTGVRSAGSVRIAKGRQIDRR